MAPSLCPADTQSSAVSPREPRTSIPPPGSPRQRRPWSPFHLNTSPPPPHPLHTGFRTSLWITSIHLLQPPLCTCTETLKHNPTEKVLETNNEH